MILLLIKYSADIKIFFSGYVQRRQVFEDKTRHLIKKDHATELL